MRMDLCDRHRQILSDVGCRGLSAPIAAAVAGIGAHFFAIAMLRFRRALALS